MGESRHISRFEELKYKEAIQDLFSHRKKERAYDLILMKRLAGVLGNPQSDFLAIHVAGTNGKGSVSLKIATALERAGLRVGLYSSPHISSFRERIQINREPISKNAILSFLPNLLGFAKKSSEPVSFFELATALAFCYFSQKKVDVAVIEAGIGGEFDATNVLEPVLSVITNIAFDHESILGDTLEQIAVAKGGIIKNRVPLILGPHAQLDLLFNLAKLRKAPVWNALKKEGFYDRENQEIAKTALEALLDRFPLTAQAIKEGLSVRPPCRFEFVSPHPIILDVAHNPDGFARLKEALDEWFPDQRCQFLLSFSKRKGMESCIDLIEQKASRISFLLDSHPRLLLQEEYPERETLHIKEGIAKALKFPEPIVICGSFFMMESVRAHLKISSLSD